MVMRPVAGGMWQHLLTLLDGVSDGYEIVVCCQDDEEQRADLEARGTQVRIVPIPSTIEVRADARARRALAEAIAAESPRIVHTHGFHAGVLGATLLKTHGGPAHVCTLHTIAVPPGATPAKRTLYNLLQRFLLRRAGRVIVVSEAVRAALPGRPRDGRVDVIPNGVDPDRVAPRIDLSTARSILGVAEANRVVGCVARLAPEKGVADFVRMAAVVNRAVPGTVFVVVGEGPLRSEIETLAADLGVVSSVRFVGRHVPASDYMQAFDVTVVPSVSEGQSLVAVESMLLGKPVVATTAGGLTEVVTSDVGRLVPAGEPDRLAAAVVEVLTGSEAGAMAQRAKTRALRLFSAKKMIEQTLRVYEQAASEGQG